MTAALCMDNMPFLMIHILYIKNYNKNSLIIISYFTDHLSENLFLSHFVHKYDQVPISQEVMDDPRAGVTSRHELPHVGARN